MMHRLGLLAIAVGMLAAPLGSAAAQAYYGYAPPPYGYPPQPYGYSPYGGYAGCTAYGYYGGWGSAPPSTAPHPACNTDWSFGNSPACTGYNCPPGGF
jgi:hypothetical protein